MTKGRGEYIKEILISDIEMKNVHTAFGATGESGCHPDEDFDPNALPILNQITLKNVIGTNITVAGNFTGIQESPFTYICLSNISLSNCCLLFYLLDMFKCFGISRMADNDAAATNNDDANLSISFNATQTWFWFLFQDFWVLEREDM
ncbi:hypothetical protein HYC85_012839 [Camellia sinensis]|uniref:Polygalacturonase n=1 Tax=Camellia sinensis TaxID=4442 RepID=A0A7J7HG85_CAMSI|nr:hypothetical protein HYC85_012839 [Camellia sinensis]